MPTITWVHISDLHLRPKDTSDWQTVRQALLSDLADHRNPQRALQAPRAGVVLKPDLLFITGDLAHMGKREEYEAFSDFLHEVWRTLDLSPEQTFIVPGNHDVDRTRVRGQYLYERIRSSITAHNLTEAELADELRQFWRFKGLFFKKFAAYQGFAARLKLPATTYYVQQLEVNAVPIQIIGINSAWVADRDGEDTKRELILGMPQLDDINQHVVPDVFPIRIALMHHPPDAIHPSDKSPDQLTALCPIILHGHLHVARALHGKEPEHEHVRIPAGATYQNSRFHEHAYNFGQLNVDTGTVNIYLRKATTGTAPRYIRDSMTYPEEAPEGHMSFVVDRLRPRAAKTIPEHPLPTLPHLRGPDLQCDPSVSATAISVSHVRKGQISGLLWGDNRYTNPQQFPERQRRIVEAAAQVEGGAEALRKAAQEFPNFWAMRQGRRTSSPAYDKREEEPVGIKSLHLDTALGIFNRGNEAGWVVPLVKEVDSRNGSSWARLEDPRWTITEMSLQYAISVLEPPEQIEVRPGEPFRLALRIVLLLEPTRQEKQKLHEKAYMLLRAGQAFASYLEGPIKGLQIPVDLTNGTVENFAFSLNITQGRDRLQIQRRDVEPFIQNWANIQQIGEERAAGGPTDENRPEV